MHKKFFLQHMEVLLYTMEQTIYSVKVLINCAKFAVCTFSSSEELKRTYVRTDRSVLYVLNINN